MNFQIGDRVKVNTKNYNGFAKVVGIGTRYQEINQQTSEFIEDGFSRSDIWLKNRHIDESYCKIENNTMFLPSFNIVAKPKCVEYCVELEYNNLTLEENRIKFGYYTDKSIEKA